MKCRKGFEIEVFKSPAGYYLGTKDQDGFPNCRISMYSDTDDMTPLTDLKVKKFANRQYGCIENEWCNEGEGCFDV